MAYTTVSAASPQKLERNMINGVHNSECGLTPKTLRKRGKNEKGANNIKTTEEGYHDCLKRIGKICHYVLEHYLIERL